MPRDRVVPVLALVAAVVCVLWMVHFFSPEQVVGRRLDGAARALEDERTLAVMSVVSREYVDPYGFTYEVVGAYVGDVIITFEELAVDVDVSSVARVGDDVVELEAWFVITGVYEGRRGLVVGRPDERCRCVLEWRREQRGWMLTRTAELHVPGFEGELSRRAAGR